MKSILKYLDDILFLLGLITFVTASYMVNAVVGTYVLGAAFVIAALLAGNGINRIRKGR